MKMIFGILEIWFDNFFFLFLDIYMKDFSGMKILFSEIDI